MHRLVLALTSALFLLPVLSPLPAFAHTGHGVGGWTAGFSHPFHGWDHIVVMVAVGLWAARQGRWWLPLVFAGVMTLGAGAAFMSVQVPGVEAAILISTVVMGGLALFRARVAAVISLAVVALFAVFHGFAHGAEMPTDSDALGYVAGFVAGSLVLHAVGYGAAYGLKASRMSEFFTRRSQRS